MEDPKEKKAPVIPPLEMQLYQAINAALSMSKIERKHDWNKSRSTERLIHNTEAIILTSKLFSEQLLKNYLSSLSRQLENKDFRKKNNLKSLNEIIKKDVGTLQKNINGYIFALNNSMKPKDRKIIA